VENDIKKVVFDLLVFAAEMGVIMAVALLGIMLYLGFVASFLGISYLIFRIME
jgi:hypothetical protein